MPEPNSFQPTMDTCGRPGAASGPESAPGQGDVVAPVTRGPATEPGQLPEGEPAGPMGRYRLLGELGRGGMGAVLKGHDPDLGRDIAVKVLLEAHQGSPGLLGRFVEEAQ